MILYLVMLLIISTPGLGCLFIYHPELELETLSFETDPV